MSRIFISYSRKDREMVDKIALELETAGIETWLDRSDITGGDKWQSLICEAIEKAELVIVVMSRNMIESRWIPREVAIADNSKKKIIPVLLHQVDLPNSIKLILQGIQHISLGKGFKKGMRELTKAINPDISGTNLNKETENTKKQSDSSPADELKNQDESKQFANDLINCYEDWEIRLKKIRITGLTLSALFFIMIPIGFAALFQFLDSKLGASDFLINILDRIGNPGLIGIIISFLPAGLGFFTGLLIWFFLKITFYKYSIDRFLADLQES
jgi:TIR domain